jgi:hypothetical protein
MQISPVAFPGLSFWPDSLKFHHNNKQHQFHSDFEKLFDFSEPRFFTRISRQFKSLLTDDDSDSTQAFVHDQELFDEYDRTYLDCKRRADVHKRQDPQSEYQLT